MFISIADTNMTLDLDWIVTDQCEKVVFCLSNSYANTHKHTVRDLISQHESSQFSLVWKVYNFQRTPCRFTSSACAYQLGQEKKADNTLIVLLFFLIVLFSLAFFSRYKEIAGSLENAVSEGLAVAPGIL